MRLRSIVGLVFVAVLATASAAAAQIFPATPSGLTTQVVGSTVTLSWNEAFLATGYRIEAGSAPGLSDLGQLSAGAATTLAVPGVPAGNYFVRVFTSHTEVGYLVEPVSGPWTVLAGYGRPAPSVQLVKTAFDTDLTGAVRVTAGAATFRLATVDLYSSVTSIPYTLTGTLAGNPVFTATGTVPNTFGNFATVTSPFPAALIDTLVITVTNPASPSCPTCAGNPVGVDNIVLRP
jgi:hypothetical protein